MSLVDRTDALDSPQTATFEVKRKSSSSSNGSAELLRPSTLYNQRQQQSPRPNSISSNIGLPKKRPSFTDWPSPNSVAPVLANPSPPLSVVSSNSLPTPPVTPVNGDGDIDSKTRSRPNSDGALQMQWEVMTSTTEYISAVPAGGPVTPMRSNTVNTNLKSRKVATAETNGNLQEESSATGRRKQLLRRNTYGPEFGPLDSDEKIAWEEEIASRLKTARRASKKRKQDDSDEPVYGTRIGEGHVNYVLMYNMLTGIRVAVSRVSAKPSRELVDEDFSAAHKLAFDIMGNELTPGVKYDFKFKDYAPWVFRHLREDFHIDPADYLVSLTSKYILSELSTPGKSGSFFYYSRDYRFIIKTIHHTEHKFMRSILKDYYHHVQQNPLTLLSRFYGLHRVKLPHGRKIHFVIMGNVFPPNKDVHETYDLKGSTLGREISEEDVKKKGSVMKDLNWEKRGRKLELGPLKRRIFIDQIEHDVLLLEKLNIMDYSLLVGIHDMGRGNKDNIRETTLSVFQPNPMTLVRQPSGSKRESKTTALRKAVAQADPVQLGPSKLPEDLFRERRQVIFYADDGGFRATDEFDNPANALYFLGIIDILTPYNYVKKIETFWKGLTQEKSKISSVNPDAYGKRFLDFMVNALKHHEDIAELQPHLSSKKNQ